MKKWTTIKYVNKKLRQYVTKNVNQTELPGRGS